MATPDARVWLLRSVPLSKNQTDTIWFHRGGAEEGIDIRRNQYNFFKQFSAGDAYTYTALTYQRIWRGYMKVHAGTESIDEVNYIMFSNVKEEYDRIYYAFVDEVVYINQNTVQINYTLDPMQCYQEELVFAQCFVNRMHTPTDGLFEWTYPEGLETGRYVQKNVKNLGGFSIPSYSEVDDGDGGKTLKINGWRILAATPQDTADMRVAGYRPYAMLIYSVDTIKKLKEVINRYPNKQADFFQLYMVPEIFGKIDETTDLYLLKDKLVPQTVSGVIPLPDKIDGYTPKNKKLFCYPYNFVTIINNTGTEFVGKYEDTKDPDFQWEIMGSPLPGEAPILMTFVPGTSKYQPSYGLSGLPWPICPLVTDSYQAWIAQNRGSLEIANQAIKTEAIFQGVGGVASLAGSIISGNVSGVAGATENLASTLLSTDLKVQQLEAKKEAARIMPDSAKSVGVNDVIYESGNWGFTGMNTMITAEFARIIDDYFTMFGYTINRLMTPNLLARPRYTYIKTVGNTFKATYGTNGLPEWIRKQATDILNNGVRFWRFDKIGRPDPANPNGLTIFDYGRNGL